MIDSYHGSLADDDIPMLTELPAVPRAAMPAARVQTRYHALLCEVGRESGGAAGFGLGTLRHGSPRWKLAVLGVALGVLAVTLALNFGPGRHGSPNPGQASGDTALAASWTPIPTKATAAEAREAAQRCSTSPGRVMLAEQRGGVTAILLASGTNRVACIMGKDQPRPDVSTWAASDPNQEFGARVMAMQMFPAAFVVGRVAPDIAKATVTLTDGAVATATVADGWAFVWWPGSATAKSVTEYAADGTTVAAFDAR